MMSFFAESRGLRSRSQTASVGAVSPRVPMCRTVWGGMRLFRFLWGRALRPRGLSGGWRADVFAPAFIRVSVMTATNERPG